MLTIYHYPRCSTCKKALAWLEKRGIETNRIDIVEAPPSPQVLARVLSLSKLPVAKLFNTSGELYREGNYKEKLGSLSEKEALDELSRHGKLIKRPLLLGADFALVGFRESDYESALG